MSSRSAVAALLTAVGLLPLAGCHSCRTTAISARPGCCPDPGPSVSGRLVPVPVPNGAAAPNGARRFVPPNGTAPVTHLEPGPRRSPLVPDRRESARLPTREPPIVSVPGKPDPKTEDEPDAQRAIDLPGFAIARPGVASGIQPFPDGVTWLKNKGYKTVLHLTTPGDDNAAAKRQFESKGLTYTSLEVSPARLTEEVYKAFVKAVEDRESHPLFVYDKDGSSAGALWYLYNRLHLKNTAEKSRAEAQRLGLRPDEEGEHATMWLAVQALVKKLKQ
jgi:protein tyrosine phosphatase (PTP) superfamily phosphohydrolase (DUF442 family)